MSTPERFMLRALALAKKAGALGEVPVGAVIVQDGKVIATGYNKRESGKNALLHAEMVAIGRACKRVGGWRLSDCDLYVTLEPCPMCTGAIINARIRRVYIGASDPKAGCMGSVCDLTQFPFNHRPQTVSGILEESCAALISDFFRDLRKAPVRREPVVLRAFTADDAPRLKRYCYPKLSEDRVREILQEWDSRCFEGKYCEFFAVTAAGELVGYVNLFEQSERIVSAGAHIFPGYRGRSYGTQSVGQLLALAKERGYTSVTARVRKSNVPSLRLCDTLGFVRKGEDVTAKGIEVWNFSRDLED